MPGWKPDPYGRHELRYFDGNVWKSAVSDDGVVITDVVDVPPPPPARGISITAAPGKTLPVGANSAPQTGRGQAKKSRFDAPFKVKIAMGVVLIVLVAAAVVLSVSILGKPSSDSATPTAPATDSNSAAGGSVSEQCRTALLHADEFVATTKQMIDASANAIQIISGPGSYSALQAQVEREKILGDEALASKNALRANVVGCEPQNSPRVACGTALNKFGDLNDVMEKIYTIEVTAALAAMKAQDSGGLDSAEKQVLALQPTFQLADNAYHVAATDCRS